MVEDFERASDQGDLDLVKAGENNEDFEQDLVHGYGDIGSDSDDRIPLLQALEGKSSMGRADLEQLIRRETEVI